MQEARQAGSSVAGHPDPTPTPGATVKAFPAFDIHQEKWFLPAETPGVRSTELESEACWLHLSLGAPGKPGNLREPQFPHL